MDGDLALSSSSAEISRSNFENNWKIISKQLPRTTSILPMVKTNAYGHDIKIISSFCQQLGAVGLGVANIFEAIELRMLDYADRILQFGRLNRETLDAAYEFNITLVVHSLDDILLLSKYPRPLTYHLEIETGMNRLGLALDDLDQASNFAKNSQHHLEGVFTHFAESEKEKSNYTKRQIVKYQQALERIKRNYSKPIITHAENSAAIFGLEQHFDWVRPGIGLYGFLPSRQSSNKDLKPVLTWMAPIMQIRRIQKGETVGYSRTFKASKDMTIATLPVGYGDGFCRSYKGMTVGFQGKKCPVIGNVSMDLTVIDISKTKNPKVGDVVFLMGQGVNQEPNAWDYAQKDKTIPYEVLTRISSRVIRRPTL